MVFLTYADSVSWISRHTGFKPDDYHRPPSSAVGQSCIVIEHQPPRMLLGLACDVASWVNERAPTEHRFFFVRATNIWPSNEHPRLYDLLRRAHGPPDAVERTPGHLALSFETDDLVILLWLALACGWDASLYARGMSRAVHINHDGIVWLVDTLDPTDTHEKLLAQWAK